MLEPLKVLLSGGSGLVGSHLRGMLEERGYEVHVLTRSRNPGQKQRNWSREKGAGGLASLETYDYIVHLAGAGIFDKRWTGQRKKLIRDSRIDTAGLLFDAVKQNSQKPRAFISASAVGYYGAVNSQHEFSENDHPAADFLGETCMLWEASAARFETIGVRTVMLRTGLVLTNRGGMLGKLLPLIKACMASPLGTGKQFMPWIHIDDLCGIYISAIENEALRGAYNAVAPAAVTNKEFMRTFANVAGKSIFLPKVPAFVLRLVFGERAQLLLAGSRISAKKITDAGYRFRYTDLRAAFGALLKGHAQG